MRFIRNDEDIMIGVDRRFIRLIKLLDQREYKARIPFQFIDQIRSACCHQFLAFGFAKKAASLKSTTDLLVQLIAVCQYNNRRRSREFPADLL